MQIKSTLTAAAAAMALILGAGGCSTVPEPGALTLVEQGSFAAGGTVLQHDGNYSSDNFLSPDGQSAFVDHAYVFYQIPADARPLPIVMQHGGAQTKRTWVSGPDGRDGFSNLFLKDRYAVYLVDQPRTGEAGASAVPVQPDTPFAANPPYTSHSYFDLCRLGHYPNLFPGSQYPEGAAALEAFERSWTPYNGDLDNDVNAQALAAVLERSGPAVLMTHSMGGTIGWRVPFISDKVRGIVALEPGGTPFFFPEGEMPEPVKTSFAPLAASAVETSLENFKKLTQIPILIIYGDYIAQEQTADVGPDKWRSELIMARKFAEAVNRHGGDATVIHLPELGIYGNSHFLMQEKNNAQIAEIIADFLSEKGLD